MIRCPRCQETTSQRKWEQFDPQLRTFVNVNTPEEIARAETLLDAG